MESRKEKHFRKLIQQAGTESPSSGFSAMLMQRINAEAEAEAVKEEALDFLLSAHSPLDQPSPDFSRLVMAEILDPKPVKEEKIISNFAWAVIASVFTAIIFYLLPAASTVSLPLPDITQKLNTIPMVYPLSLFAGSMLLLLDYLLRQKVGEEG